MDDESSFSFCLLLNSIIPSELDKNKISNMDHHAVVCRSFLAETGVKVANCYQCGKCSGGCPLNSEMDYPPSMIMRMLQYNTPQMDEKVLSSYSIWLCLSCEMCYQRCPMEMNVPAVMDALRQESLRREVVHPKASGIVAFHQSFLESVKNGGRLHEAGMVVSYKFKTGNWVQDMSLTPQMMQKGKLNFFATRIHGYKAVSRLFNKKNSQ